MRHFRTKRDANHQSIVTALRAMGASVVDLSACGGGVPDLLVGYGARNVLLEVKNPAHRKVGGQAMTKTRERQANFRATWKGQTALVETIEAAIKTVFPQPQGDLSQSAE